MIKTTLPIVEKSLDGNNKLVVVEKEIKVEIDTSLFAEERWEANFPHNAKTETLFGYIERVQQNGLTDKTHVLANLKALYCFMEGDDIPDFKHFCQLFDLAEGERLKRLVDKIKEIFEIVLSASTADSKNS